MKKNIWFDMDGTIADLYGVNEWLAKLIAEDATPYAEARPLINMNSLARVLNRLQRNGYTINIISWASKNSTKAYERKVEKAKREWLKKHLASVRWDKIEVVAYGTPKRNEARFGILFDDEQANREQWGEGAFDVQDIIEILKGLK